MANPTAPNLPYPTPTGPGQYAVDYLAFVGDPQSTPNVETLTAWGEAESPSLPGFNAWGTTLPLGGSTPVPGNTAGVQEYPSLATGLQAAQDMIEGRSPQTTPLAPQLAKDLASGSASTKQLVNDVYASSWDGHPDKYDADAIATSLQLPAPGGPGILGQITNFVTFGANPNNAGGANSPDPVTRVGAAGTSAANTVKSATSGLLGNVGLYILKGVLTLTFGAVGVFGVTLLTGRSGGKEPPAAPGLEILEPSQAASEPLPPFAEDLGEAAAV